MTSTIAAYAPGSAAIENRKAVCSQRADFYRRRADEARCDAMAIQNSVFRDVVLDVAHDFDELALAMDQFAALEITRENNRASASEEGMPPYATALEHSVQPSNVYRPICQDGEKQC